MTLVKRTITLVSHAKGDRHLSVMHKYGSQNVVKLLDAWISHDTCWMRWCMLHIWLKRLDTCPSCSIISLTSTSINTTHHSTHFHTTFIYSSFSLISQLDSRLINLYSSKFSLSYKNISLPLIPTNYILFKSLSIETLVGCVQN